MFYLGKFLELNNILAVYHATVNRDTPCFTHAMFSKLK